jgi:2-polyprenyl-6-hydroxyphenyl methylase/3-demethylubiquinone-9 3-methyltransferase
MAVTGFPNAPVDRRFEFGRNWRAFLSVLNEDRIAAAEQSLRDMLQTDSLAARSFLDIGSGSGLFSLAAMRLGARRVHSFDNDPQSVACTAELRRRYFADDARWSIEHGSVLDEAYVQRLGPWDVVYSWGVLHHTGDLRRAVDVAARAVAEDGCLCIAIYNDQGLRSRLWRGVKRVYNRGGAARRVILAAFVPFFFCGALGRDVMSGRSPFRRYRAHVRGMSPVHDWIDWLGGYPFEVASREDIGAFLSSRGFNLGRLNSCGRKSGCNQFVFTRASVPARDKGRDETGAVDRDVRHDELIV